MLFHHIARSRCTVLRIQWYIPCKVLNLARIDFAPCSLRRPISAPVSLDHGTNGPPSKCIFIDMEESGNDGAINCVVAGSVERLYSQLFNTGSVRTGHFLS